MLKKLFKYEFKSTAKIMLILYAILIVTTAVGSVVLYSLDLDQAGESKLASILSVSAIVLYILAIFAVLIVMYVYLCVHFYRTMYSAQGYLTHTLPVKALAPFHVKLITSFVWMFLSMALIGHQRLCRYIGAENPYLFIGTACVPVLVYLVYFSLSFFSCLSSSLGMVRSIGFFTFSSVSAKSQTSCTFST